MDRETMLKLLNSTGSKDREFIADAEEAERYYKGDNDIKRKRKITRARDGQRGADNPLRKADNKIANNFYNFLVDQKVDYLLGYPIIIDVGSKQGNEKLSAVLGTHFMKQLQHVGINASNCKVGWIHVWKNVTERGYDENGNPTAETELEYGVVDSKQIKAQWGGPFNQDLLAVRRTYEVTDDDGLVWEVTEYWDKEKCYSYKKEKSGPNSSLIENNCYLDFNVVTGEMEPTNEYIHGFDEVPFIAFFNNQFHLNDLKGIKGYIDSYDIVYSGYVDDLEDVAEIIFILENLGGTLIEDFMRDLKDKGAVKVISNEETKTDVRTLTIDIPVDARNALLDTARKNIFEQGRGVDPMPESYGNTSGEALKYMYANLALKAKATQNEFEVSIERFIKLICNDQGIPYTEPIKQTWTPNRINNDTDTINNIKNSYGIVSLQTILENHPWVKNVEDELERLAEEQDQKNNDVLEQAMSDYINEMNNYSQQQFQDDNADNNNDPTS